MTDWLLLHTKDRGEMCPATCVLSTPFRRERHQRHPHSAQSGKTLASKSLIIRYRVLLNCADLGLPTTTTSARDFFPSHPDGHVRPWHEWPRVDCGSWIRERGQLHLRHCVPNTIHSPYVPTYLQDGVQRYEGDDLRGIRPC